MGDDMPYRKATPEETCEWLGAGVVMAAVRKPLDLAPPKTDVTQTDLTQIEHDQLMAEQTPEQYRRMIKGLGAFARSKLGGGPTSTFPRA